MSTLPLVAPEYRDAAGVVPVFDYDTQPVGKSARHFCRRMR